MAQAEAKLTAEEVENSFRKSLEDLVTIADKLSHYCQSVDELIGMAKLATTNDGQLRLVIGLMTAGKK